MLDIFYAPGALLRAPQLVIQAVQLYQLLVASLLGKHSMSQHNNIIGGHDTRQSALERDLQAVGLQSLDGAFLCSTLMELQGISRLHR